MPIMAALFTAEQQVKKQLYGIPSRERTLAQGEANARELLFLVESDRNCKVSRQRFMAFMHAEFNRVSSSKPRKPEDRQTGNSQVASTASTAVR